MSNLIYPNRISYLEQIWPADFISRWGHAHSATDADNDNLALFFRAASFPLVFPRYVFHLPSYLKWFRKYYMYIITFSGISHPRCERMSTSKLSARYKMHKERSAHFVTVAFDGSSFRIPPPLWTEENILASRSCRSSDQKLVGRLGVWELSKNVQIGQELNSRNSSFTTLLPLAYVVFGKVMFSIVSVCLSTGGTMWNCSNLFTLGTPPQKKPHHHSWQPTAAPSLYHMETPPTDLFKLVHFGNTPFQNTTTTLTTHPSPTPVPHGDPANRSVQTCSQQAVGLRLKGILVKSITISSTFPRIESTYVCALTTRASSDFSTLFYLQDVLLIYFPLIDCDTCTMISKCMLLKKYTKHHLKP